MNENDTIVYMKQCVSEMIYSSVSIEGIGATFAQTKEIIEEGTAAGVSIEDIDKILNIKRAWKYLFERFDEKLSWDLYSNYNRIIGKGYVKDAGSVRPPNSVVVGTGDIDPFVPPDVTGKEDFDRILITATNSYPDPDDIAAALFLMLCRAQFFHDGNKRSAQLLVNHYLAHIDAGCIFCIPEGTRDSVLDILVDFYMARTSLDDAEFDIYDLTMRPVPKPIALDTSQIEDLEHGEEEILAIHNPLPHPQR